MSLRRQLFITFLKFLIFCHQALFLLIHNSCKVQRLCKVVHRLIVQIIREMNCSLVQLLCLCGYHLLLHEQVLLEVVNLVKRHLQFLLQLLFFPFYLLEFHFGLRILFDCRYRANPRLSQLIQDITHNSRMILEMLFFHKRGNILIIEMNLLCHLQRSNLGSRYQRLRFEPYVINLLCQCLYPAV